MEGHGQCSWWSPRGAAHGEQACLLSSPRSPAALIARSWGKASPVTPAREDALMGVPHSPPQAHSLRRQHGLIMTSVIRAGDTGPGDE